MAFQLHKEAHVSATKSALGAVCLSHEVVNLFIQIRGHSQKGISIDGKIRFNTPKEVKPAAYLDGLTKSHNKLANIKCVVMKMFLIAVPSGEEGGGGSAGIKYDVEAFQRGVISFQHVPQNGRHLEKQGFCCEGKLHLNNKRLQQKQSTNKATAVFFFAQSFLMFCIWH